MTTFEQDEKHFSHEKSLGLVTQTQFYFRDHTLHLLKTLCRIHDITPSQLVEKLIVQDIARVLLEGGMTWEETKPTTTIDPPA
jgi:hypothetical protein